MGKIDFQPLDDVNVNSKSPVKIDFQPLDQDSDNNLGVKFMADEGIKKVLGDTKNPSQKLEAFVKNAANEVGLGYYPQVAGGVKSLLSDDSYVNLRDKEIKRLKELEQLEPESSSVGKTAGLLGSLAIPIGGEAKTASLGSKILKGAGVGAGISALSNPGDEEGKVDPLQLEQREDQAKTGGLIGGALPIVGKGIESGVNSNFGQKLLSDLSDSSAIKAAGGMLKDFRRIYNKNQASSIADTLKNATVKMTDEAGNVTDKKLLSIGDTVHDVAEKSKELKNQTGEKISNIYNDIDEKLTDPNFNKTIDVKNDRFNPVDDKPELEKMILDKYGKKVKGNEVVNKIFNDLQVLDKRSDSLSDTLALKNEFDDLINYSKSSQDMPLYQQALKDVRNYIRDKTNNYVDEIGPKLDVVNSNKLKELNKTYGNVSEIESIAADKLNRERTNKTFGLTDYISGGIGAAAGGAIGGAHGSLEGALLGAAANKFGSKYGPGLLTYGSQGLANVLEQTAPLNKELSPLVQKLNTLKNQGLLTNYLNSK